MNRAKGNRGRAMGIASARRVAISAAIALTALLLVACGSAATATPTSPSQTAELPNPTEAASPTPEPAAAEQPPDTGVESTVAPVPDAPAEPSGPSYAELRAQQLADTLEAAGIQPAAPGQLTVVVDPGHGGVDGGAAANGVAEISSNLDFALRVEEILIANGYNVVLTRRDGGPSLLSPEILNADPTDFTSTRPDREARTQLARTVNADVFVSIHSNGHPDPTVNGIESWYHPSALEPGQNRHFGELVVGRVFAELHASGYPANSLGTKNDTCWRQFGGVCRSIYVISPPLTLSRETLENRGYDPEAAGFLPGQNYRSTRGTAMPAVLVELLFISNPADAAALRNGALRQAMARGVAQGVIDMLDSLPSIQ